MLLYCITLLFYSADKGDLIRIGFIKDDNIYDRNIVFSKEIKKKINFTTISNINLNLKHHFDVLTIGDSFSEQRNFGYQNYLADNNSVLHIDRNLHENPIETAYSILNGDLLNNIKVKYIVIQSVQRDFIERAITLDTTKTITASSLLASMKKLKSKNVATEETAKAPFYSSTLIKLPLYTLYYQFDDNAFYSKTYQVATKKNAFSTNNHKLLFLGEDIKKAKKKNTLADVEILNNQLNIVAKKYKDKGIQLIVLPCPDKFDAYYDQIVDNSKYLKPLFFTNFDMVKKNYLYVDSKKLLTNAINTKKDIYFYDDTHWSPIASKLIADDINRIIKISN